MKPNNPEHDQQLDELAAGLDAGWDTPAPAQTQTSSSQPPLSIPPSGEALDALDADWDVDTSDSAPAPAASKQRSSRQRPNAARPSQQRATQARPGVAPLKVTKQERREAERKRQAHQAQQRSAAKLQRKAERQEEARRASEERRAEQQQLTARQSSSPKRSATSKSSSESSTPSPKRVAKQARKQNARLTPSEAPAKVAPPVVLDRGAKKLIPIVAIAVVVGATLCFALLRAHY
jgi:membrane protein involved in colicin uptake